MYLIEVNRLLTLFLSYGIIRFMDIDFQLLREAREAVGLRQKDAAEKVGMPKQLLCAYEKGHQRPTLKYFPLLCAIYGKPMEYFLRKTNEKN
jgi:transcriptional regulator with XRE-family HTH domain